MSKYKDTIELIVRLVIKRDKKVLICVGKKTGNHFLPGGHVEFGDTLESTIYKEMNEELGWEKSDITSIKFLGYLEHSYTNKIDSELHCELNMIFDVTISDQTNVKVQEDHITFKWVDISKLDSVHINPPQIVKYLMNSKN